MKKFKLLAIGVGIVLILTAVIFLANPEIVGAAEECKIVTIRGRSGLEPNILTIKKGDCVVWINFSGALTQTEDVLLTFKEGQKCVRATKSPVGFAMDASKGCYVAGWLGRGQTASLMFSDPGTYDYQVDFKVGGNIKGTIVVK
jgi:plastocyanin